MTIGAGGGGEGRVLAAAFVATGVLDTAGAAAGEADAAAGAAAYKSRGITAAEYFPSTSSPSSTYLFCTVTRWLH